MPNAGGDGGDGGMGPPPWLLSLFRCNTSVRMQQLRQPRLTVAARPLDCGSEHWCCYERGLALARGCCEELMRDSFCELHLEPSDVLRYKAMLL